MTSSSQQMWTYRDSALMQHDLSGLAVEAVDGSIGKVDEATNDVGQSFIVVDTGPWIFGKKVMLPAGVVERVDTDEQTIYVNRTKEEIKNAPEFDPERGIDPTYQDELGGYYGRYYS
jgi:hypothetical protein